MHEHRHEIAAVLVIATATIIVPSMMVMPFVTVGAVYTTQ